jgi:hypothetical protein
MTDTCAMNEDRGPALLALARASIASAFGPLSKQRENTDLNERDGGHILAHGQGGWRSNGLRF